MNLKFPKNVFAAFGVLFIITAIVVPIQNLIVWGPDFLIGFYTGPEFTAEKFSIGVIGLGILMILHGHKKSKAILG